MVALCKQAYQQEQHNRQQQQQQSGIIVATIVGDVCSEIATSSVARCVIYCQEC